VGDQFAMMGYGHHGHGLVTLISPLPFPGRGWYELDDYSYHEWFTNVIQESAESGRPSKTDGWWEKQPETWIECDW
jgi:hypothetical protein